MRGDVIFLRYTRVVLPLVVSGRLSRAGVSSTEVFLWWEETEDPGRRIFYLNGCGWCDLTEPPIYDITCILISVSLIQK